MNDQVGITRVGDWVVRQRLPKNSNTSARIMLLLHGWTGDENSMWIFTPRIPEDYLILAPRGITKTSFGGYGWENVRFDGWPKAADFHNAIRGLFELVDMIDFPDLDSREIDVMGFSQGGALGCTMSLQYPERIGKLASLSGFIPEGLGDEIANRRLKGKKLFVAHGTRDNMVSLDKARTAVRDLKLAGSDVIYCEEDVGHKLSAGCFRAMDDYFARDIPGT